MEWLKSVSNWIKVLGVILVALTATYGTLHGWFGEIKEKGVSELREQERQNKLDNIITLYDLNISHVNLPLELVQKDSIFEYQVYGINKRIDSIYFMVTQINALLFSKAYVPSYKATDEHGCEWWLKKDFNGQIWKVERENGRLTVQYTVRWNAVNNSYEYTDYNGVVKTLKHKWEAN